MITPVTILTGFLGSGKTTLLARAVRDARFSDTAVIVNEWGEVAIDHALVREASGEIVALPGGCICCRAAGEVVSALRELHFRRAEGVVAQFRRVVIETSGLADPAPLAATLIEVPLTAARYALAGIVATVDAVNGMQALDAHPEAVKQAAIADRLVLTKCDLVGENATRPLKQRLDELAPAAAIVESRAGDLDPQALFETGLYRGQGRLADARGWLNAGAYRPAGRAAPPRHDPAIASFSWSRLEPLPWPGVERALASLCEALGPRLLRMKGLVSVEGEPGPRAVHAIGHTLYPSARLGQWPDEDRATRLVFIGRDLEESQVLPHLESLR